MDEKRLNELAKRAYHTRECTFTKFIEPSEENDCRRAANENDVYASFYGGFESAERNICRFSAYENDDSPCPISCVEITWNTKFASCEHRDLLGAVMGLGIERDTTGDIVVCENGRAYLFCTDDMAAYIIANLTGAGRATLKCRVYDGEIDIPEPEGTIKRITLASERLDAVIAEAYNLSRGAAQKLVTSGLVKLDHLLEMRPDVKLKEGSLISVRGHGRTKVLSCGGTTKRGRLAYTVFIYGKK